MKMFWIWSRFCEEYRMDKADSSVDNPRAHLVQADIDENADDLTQLQQRLHELSTKLMTYVGVLQRDAPAIYPPEIPSASSPTSKASPGIAASPKLEKTPALLGSMNDQVDFQASLFAEDIASSFTKLNRLIDNVEVNIESKMGKETELIIEADSKAREATKALADATSRAEVLLNSLRESIEALDLPSVVPSVE
mmetsp:Transcript_12611/g.22739  ORF Transcript_12611/g.22739 Transcript_12611/m.22739 type:complete len:195 (+) Transcript_12611:1-585(+)